MPYPECRYNYSDNLLFHSVLCNLYQSRYDIVLPIFNDRQKKSDPERKGCTYWFVLRYSAQMKVAIRRKQPDSSSGDQGYDSEFLGNCGWSETSMNTILWGGVYPEMIPGNLQTSCR